MALVDAPVVDADLEPERPAGLKGTLSASTPTDESSVAVVEVGPAKAEASAAPRSSEPAESKGFDDLTPSPHDNPLVSQSELHKSERLCIRDVPDECVRVADAYHAGTLIPQNRKRASQYRNLGFKAYIRLCEGNQPEACYALARMYLQGDGVKANPSYAKNLMRRVVEVCRYRKAEICERLVEEAPMPPKKRKPR